MDDKRLHALLSDLHRFLAVYDIDELREASSKSQDCHLVLTSVVEALSRPNSPHEERALSSTRSSAQIKSIHEQVLSSEIEEVENLLRRSGLADSKADMEAIAHAFELDFHLSPKDGRERSMARLARVIAGTSAKTQSRITKELSHGSLSETAGWLGVIRRRQ